MIILPCIPFFPPSKARSSPPRRTGETVTMSSELVPPQIDRIEGNRKPLRPRPAPRTASGAKGWDLLVPWRLPPRQRSPPQALGLAMGEALPKGTGPCLIPAPECRCIGGPKSVGKGCRLTRLSSMNLPRSLVRWIWSDPLGHENSRGNPTLPGW